MSEWAAQLAEQLPSDVAALPGWVAELRRNGAAQFRAHGLPGRKDEAWKYTGLGLPGRHHTRLALDVVSDAFTPAEPLVESQLRVDMLEGHMWNIDGEIPRGVSLLPLSNALNDGPEGLRALLESLPQSPEGKDSADGFTALNNAVLGAGLVVHVAADTNAGRLLLNWSTASKGNARLFNSRLCLLLEAGASLQLIEQYEGPESDANTANIVVQGELAKSAVLQHVRLQQLSEQASLVTRTEVSQHDDSHYRYFGFDIGGGLVRHDLHARLLGEGAQVSLNGAYLLDGQRHVDNHARVDHEAPGGVSEQYFRGVAGGSSKAVFNTAVCVHPGADGTEALQSNANILLSARAEIDTKPELEIYADEVVASHGATVGQLDEQAVFYLRSRGLDEDTARQMLTTAFCRSVSDRLEATDLADVVSARMLDAMPQAE